MSKFLKEGFVIAFLTSFIFTAGQAGYQGYYIGYGIDPFVISLSLQDMMYIGFLTIFSDVFSTFYLLFILALFYIIFSHEGKNISDKSPFQKLSKMKIFLASSQFINNARNYFYEHEMVTLIVILPFILISFIGLVSSYEKAAKNKAFKDISIIKSKGKAMDRGVVEININGIFKKAFLIGCGSNKCAGVTLDDFQVVYFNPEDMTHLLPKVNEK